MSKRNKRKRLESFNKEQQDFFKKWDQYFGEYNKGEAGTKWARNKEFDLLATDTPYEQRLYLLNWFENLMRKFKPHSCWILECGLIYCIDKVNSKVYYFNSHPAITRRVRTLTPEQWQKRVSQLTTEKLDENKEWSRGGHTTYFHAGNLFFLNHLGYDVKELDIAPGWWINAGVGALEKNRLTPEAFELNGDNESAKTYINKLMFDINTYRLKEIDRIATRLYDIMNGKYPGEKIHDAILHTDSDGVKWRQEQDAYLRPAQKTQ